MGNPFDKFDEPKQGASAARKANPFDQFDDVAPTPFAAPKKSYLDEFGGIVTNAFKRGSASTVATGVHTASDFIDQTIQAPLRNVMGLLGLGEMFTDPLGAAGVAEESLGVEREINADRKKAQQEIGGRPSLAQLGESPLAAVGQYGKHLANSGAESLPAFMGAIALRNPQLAATALGASTGAQTYTDLRADGLGRLDAAKAGAMNAAIETAGESLGLPFVMGKAGKGSLLKAMLAGGGQEAPVQLAQQRVEDDATGKDTPIMQQLGDALDAGLIGAGLGAGGHGLSVGVDALSGNHIPTATKAPNAAPRETPSQSGAFSPEMIAGINADVSTPQPMAAPDVLGDAPLGVPAESTADLDALLTRNVTPEPTPAPVLDVARLTEALGIDPAAIPPEAAQALPDIANAITPEVLAALGLPPSAASSESTPPNIQAASQNPLGEVNGQPDPLADVGVRGVTPLGANNGTGAAGVEPSQVAPLGGSARGSDAQVPGDAAGTQADGVTDALSAERRSRIVDGLQPNTDLDNALNAILIAGLNEQALMDAVRYGVENGRPDIAAAAAAELRKSANSAAKQKPGVPEGSPKYAAIAADIARRAQEAAKLADEAEAMATQPARAEKKKKLPPAMFTSGKNVQAVRMPNGRYKIRRKLAKQWQPWQDAQPNFEPTPGLFREHMPQLGTVTIDGQKIKLGERQAPLPKPKKRIPSLLDAIAGVGLNREAFRAQGVDPAQMTMRIGIKPLFRKEGGMTLDQLREMMQQDGYLPRDPEDAPPVVDDNDALDVLMRALAGEEIYSEDQGDAVAQQRMDDRAEQEEWEAEMADQHPDIADNDYDAADSLLDAMARANRAGVLTDANPGESHAAYAARLEQATNEATPNDTNDEADESLGGFSTERNLGAEPEGFNLTAQTKPAAKEVAPTQGGGLFGAPKTSDFIDNAQRNKDAQRDGKTGTGRTDMLAGDGNLFAGKAPEQSQIDAPKTKAGGKGESWILRDKTTGKVVMETTDRKKVDALNTDKYEAVPMREYYAELNQPGSLARNNAEGKPAPKKPATTEKSSEVQTDLSENTERTKEAESRRQGDEEAESLGLRAAVNDALGKVAENVIYVHDLDGLPKRLRDGVKSRMSQREGKGSTGALYDQKPNASGKHDVYIITGVVNTPARAVWNAAHEIAGHAGLRALLGDRLNKMLHMALQNPTVFKVSKAIAAERGINFNTEAGKLLAAEEALSELSAAVRTGNFAEIESRYKTPVPEGIRESLTRAIDNFLRRLKAALDDIFGDHKFTDEDVRSLLEASWEVAQGKRAGGAVSGDGEMEQVVFHGTPHTVDRFSLQKIGTGEGAQAFGWGMYFASAKEIAQHYRDTLAKPQIAVKGEALQFQADDFANALRNILKNAKKGMAFGEAVESEANALEASKMPSRIKDAAKLRGLKEGDIGEVAAGNLYRVDVPEDADLLDWDKPLSEQPEKAKPLLREMWHKAAKSFQQIDKDGNPTVAQIHHLYTQHRGGNAKAFSEEMNAAGVPGLRYLDGTSRTKGEGSANYVIWDESAIGQPQSALESTEAVDQTDTPEFKRWSRNAPVIEADEMWSDYGGGPAVFKLFHGTTADFEVFDRDRANIESDFGAGFYFSNTAEDVGNNYAGLGPDLTLKIQREAERIAQETDRDYDDPEVVAEARQKWVQNDGATMPVFVRAKNPAIVGGPNETQLTYEELYDEESDSYDEPIGSLVDFIEALRNEASDYSDGDVEGAIAALFDDGIDGEIGLSDVIAKLKANEEFGYYTDDNGDLASSEIIRAALERAGFDAIVDYTVDAKFGSQKRIGKAMAGMSEDTVHVIAFEPTQIKSSIGNNGEFNQNNPSILESVEYTPEQSEFMQKAGVGKDSRGTMQKLKDWMAGKVPDIQKAELIQSVFDGYYGLKMAVENTGNISPENDPYTAVRQINIASTMEAILRFGAPKMVNGALMVDRTIPGLYESLTPVHNNLPGFFGWMVARRAQVLKRQFRENLMSDADIKAGLSLAVGNEAVFNKVAGDYLRMKNAILDFAEQHGQTIDPVAREAWDHAEYVPFYRDGDSAGPGTRQGIANQSSGIKRLKGGEQALRDPLANIVQNFTKLMDSALKNRAMLLAVDQLGPAYFEKQPLAMSQAVIPMDQVKKHLLETGVDQATVDSMPSKSLKGVAKMLSIEAPTGDDIVRVMRAGKSEYYKVADPLLIRSITSIHEKAPSDWIKPLVWTKNMLTAGATATPDFFIRNTLRDTGEATITSRENFVPLWDTMRGAVESLRENEFTQDLMMAGSYFHGGLFQQSDYEATARATKRALRKHGLTENAAEKIVKTLINPKRWWDIYRSGLEASEMGSRVSLARNRVKAGGTFLEAAFEAKDFLDFQLKGDAELLRFFVRVVPFLNARLQGNYRLARAATAKDRKKAVLARMAMLAMATTALYAWNMLAYRDDYDELPDWEKDAYWHIAPGTDRHIRIAKPFELGLVAGTAVERGLASLANVWTKGEMGDQPSQTWKSLLRGVMDTLAFNPTPQGLKPAVETFFNYDTFKGGKIESDYEKKKAPSDRKTPRTSATAVAASEGMESMLGDNALSPKQIEHLWRGYFGGMGMYLLKSSDWVTRNLTDAPEMPDKALRDFPAIGAIYRGDGVNYSTSWGDQFYDLRDQAEKRSDQIKVALNDKDWSRAKKLEAEWGWLVGKQKESKRAKAGFMHQGVRDMKSANDAMSGIRKDDEAIYASRTMTGKEKRAALEANAVERNKIAKKMVRTMREAEREWASKPPSGRISDYETYRKNYEDKLAKEGKSRGEIAAEMKVSQIHHVIPDNVVKSDPLMKAAMDVGYSLDRGENTLGMPRKSGGQAIAHNTSHPKYDKQVRAELASTRASLVAEFGSLKAVPKDRLLREVSRIESKFYNKIKAKNVPTKNGRLAVTTGAKGSWA